MNSRGGRGSFNLVAREPLLRYAGAMKVLLISANATHAPHPVYPLGLDYLVGALAPRHEVHIWDVNLAGSGESLETALCRIHPEVIGLSIRNIDNVDAGAAKSCIPGYEGMVRLIRRCTG